MFLATTRDTTSYLQHEKTDTTAPANFRAFGYDRMLQMSWPARVHQFARPEGWCCTEKATESWHDHEQNNTTQHMRLRSTTPRINRHSVRMNTHKSGCVAHEWLCWSCCGLRMHMWEAEYPCKVDLSCILHRTCWFHFAVDSGWIRRCLMCTWCQKKYHRCQWMAIRGGNSGS